MASDSVDRALITQFSDMIHVKAQQIRARLRPYVQIKPMTGDIMAYDGLGDVESREVSGRVVKTVFADIEHLRRKIPRKRFEVTLPIDGHDVDGMLLDPSGPYAEACIRAMERRFDRVCIESMFADVETGREFDTTTTFANDGGRTVDATAGLTYEKLLETEQNFTDDEVGTDLPETFVLGITGKEHTALMQESELTSGDFTRQFAIEKGQMVRAGAFELIRYGGQVNNPMLSVSGGTRDCFAMSTRGICVGISKQFKISIMPNPNYVDLKQVQIVFTLGAVRTEGKLVQKVQTTE